MHQLGVDAATRTAELSRYRVLLNEVVDVVLIAATASLKNATLVHRHPHFAVIPPNLLKQEVLPVK